MAALTNAEIRVSTEILQQKADTVTGLIDRLEQQYEELSDKVEGMRRYWMGDRADSAIETNEKDRELVREMLTRLREYPSDLLLIAGVYTVAESTAVSSSAPLASDVII